MQKKILVRGPVLTQSGYGEHCRFLLRALRANEDKFDIYLHALNWGKTNWISKDDDERRWIDNLIKKTVVYQDKGNVQEGQYDISAQVTIPNEWQAMAPYNIGVTAGMETTFVTPQWVEKSKLMSKIIVVSEHAKESFLAPSFQAKNEATGQVYDDFKCDTPIDVVHYPVRTYESADLQIDFETDFNFLVVAQWSIRKNIENTVRWFVEEFIDQPVGLVLKMNTAKNCILDRRHTYARLKQELAKYPQRKCKVYLLHGYISDGEMITLYTHPKIKALISLAHGEGFGLPIFEAAYSGLPVVASDWSGHKDFLHMPVKDKKGKIKNKAMFARVDYELEQVPAEFVWDGVVAPESKWANPEAGSYKMRLREIYKDHNRFKSQAKKLQKHILKNFAQEKQYKSFVNSILGKTQIPMEDFEGVSFCISTNGAKPEKTIKAIQSIKKAGKKSNKRYEVIVCGNIEPFEDVDGVRLINAKKDAEEGWLAKLRNIAAENTSYDVLVFADDDILFPDTWMTRLEEYSNKNGWNVLGNKILLPDEGRYWDRALVNPHIMVDYDHPETDKRLYQCGCFWIIRKSTFEKEKWDAEKPYYAERFGQINEDVEYSERLFANGYTLSFDKENLVWHWDDSYVEWNPSRNASQCLRKSIVEENFGVDIFPPESRKFKRFVENI